MLFCTYMWRGFGIIALLSWNWVAFSVSLASSDSASSPLGMVTSSDPWYLVRQTKSLFEPDSHSPCAIWVVSSHWSLWPSPETHPCSCFSISHSHCSSLLEETFGWLFTLHQQQTYSPCAGQSTENAAGLLVLQSVLFWGLADIGTFLPKAPIPRISPKKQGVGSLALNIISKRVLRCSFHAGLSRVGQDTASKLFLPLSVSLCRQDALFFF
jgi:hypothetical protein